MIPECGLHYRIRLCWIIAVLALGGHSSTQAAQTVFFNTPEVYPIVSTGSFPTPYSVAVGDFIGDGKPDLAVATNDVGISIFLGNGNGTFQPGVNYATGGQPESVAVGDFNGDGKLDLAVAAYASHTVSILLGNGDGTFQRATSYSAGSGPKCVVVGDFNGDGRLDLAVANYVYKAAGTVEILLGNGEHFPDSLELCRRHRALFLGCGRF